jgi:ribosomal protein S21
VTYGGETWTLTSTDENALRIFERKILKKDIWTTFREWGV